MHRNFAAVFLFVSMSWASAHAHHLAVVTHPDSTTASVTSAELGKIFKSEMTKWPDGREVMIVLNRNSVVSMQILERLTGMPDGKAHAFIAAHKSSFLLTDSDGEVLDLVASRPGALGMVDVHDVDSRIKVLKVDGKLPLEKGYLPH